MYLVLRTGKLNVKKKQKSFARIEETRSRRRFTQGIVRPPRGRNLGSANKKGGEPRPRPAQRLYRVGHLQDDFFAFARTFAQRALCAAAMRSLAAADRRCFARFPNLDDRRECPVILLRAAITSSSCRSSPSARLRSCFNCSSTAPSSVIYPLPLLGIQSLLSRILDLLTYVVVNAPLRALQFGTSKPNNVCGGASALQETL
jgi:hypothetical protein